MAATKAPRRSSRLNLLNHTSGRVCHASVNDGKRRPPERNTCLQLPSERRNSPAQDMHDNDDSPDKAPGQSRGESLVAPVPPSPNNEVPQARISGQRTGRSKTDASKLLDRHTQTSSSSNITTTDTINVPDSSGSYLHSVPAPETHGSIIPDEKQECTRGEDYSDHPLHVDESNTDCQEKGSEFNTKPVMKAIRTPKKEADRVSKKMKEVIKKRKEQDKLERGKKYKSGSAAETQETGMAYKI